MPSSIRAAAPRPRAGLPSTAAGMYAVGGSASWPLHLASRAGDYLGAINPRDREGTWHGSQFGLEDAGQQVGAAQPRSTILPRANQRAPYRRLGRSPQRKGAVDLRHFRRLVLCDFEAGKSQRPLTLVAEGRSQSIAIYAGLAQQPRGIAFRVGRQSQEHVLRLDELRPV